MAIDVQFSSCAVNLYENSPGMFMHSHTVAVNKHFSVSVKQLGMFRSHFNKHFLLVTLLMKMFVTIINPLAGETIFRVNTDHIKASTTTWPCILDVAFFMILAAVINTPFPRQAFLRVSNQCKTTMFTFWPLAFHVAL